MQITAKISGIKYTPLLCKKLKIFPLRDIEKVFLKESVFLLAIDNSNLFAISRWVSPKRTRSYPYPRVYDTLSFSGKRVAVIPVIKDEGEDGDRDFIQWDTISLMSLLQVYVIITYYADASPSSRPKNKITSQKFSIDHIRFELERLTGYQSDALHWNMKQIERVDEVAEKAIRSYRIISEKLGIKMHSFESALRRLEILKKGKKEFMSSSRDLSRKAQERESVTSQPKEKLSEGAKAVITITNYLGGSYYFTVDEAYIDGRNLLLVEGKHTRKSELPKESDIKDGLLKMVLFSNLEEVMVGGREYSPLPILKLTTGSGFNLEKLSLRERKVWERLKEEAEKNSFKIMLNGDFVV